MILKSIKKCEASQRVNTFYRGCIETSMESRYSLNVAMSKTANQ